MENEHKLIKKIKGIFFNYIGDYHKDFVNTTIKIMRKMNYIGLGKLGQSIHHITYYFKDENNIDKITIYFRKAGIKPEDIDGFLLKKKNEKEELSPYEKSLLNIWTVHYKTGKTSENKIVDSIVRELHKLKNKWTENNISYKNLSEEDIDKLKIDAEELIKEITKYEKI